MDPKHFNLNLQIDKAKPYHKHLLKWKHCTRCPLGTNSGVVLLRGTLPASIAFIGEAPGATEDATGYPFVGRAGELFQDAIDHAQLTHPFTHASTNIVGCWPRDSKNKTHQPTSKEAEICSPRVLESLALIEPQAIIRLGEVAARFLTTKHLRKTPFQDIPLYKLRHPAYLLRQGDTPKKPRASRSHEYHRFILTLKTIISELA